MQEENNDIYIKFLKGELTETEKDQLTASGEMDVLNRVLSESDSWKLPTVKHSYAEFKQNKLANKSKKNRGWMRIAASIAIIIGLTTFSYLRFFNITTITTGAGESLALTLPDGCEVLLNGNSTLSYNNWNWKAKREVEMDGQAYFDISVKGPFHVSFNGGSVDVVGTEFDILSHNNTNIIKCFEGKVDVTFTKETYRLTHNMGVRNFSSGAEKEFEFEGDKANWVTEYTQFNNAPLEEVISALSLRYDIEIITSSIPVETLTFTGRFPNNDAIMALEMVFKSMSIKYTKTGDKVVLK